jgi:MFS family permease
MTTATLRADAHVIGLVGIAHGLSHFLQLVIAPLFVFMRDDFGASYAQLGVVVAVMFSVSGILQTVAGFLVDRLGPRMMLITGLALFGSGLVVIGLAPSYAWLFPGAALAGAGNSVFHPADYALLNARVSERRLGYAFSVHGIVGNIGWALGPIVAVPLAVATSWRTSLMACGALGIAFALVLATQSSIRLPVRRAVAAAGGGGLRQDAKLLASRPVVLAFAFFLLFAVALIIYQTFGSPALVKLYDLPVATAASALSVLLFAGALGILLGGFIAARTQHHGAAASLAVAVGAGLSFMLAAGAVPTAMILPVMALLGCALSSIGPSRDILIRGIAPAHSRGKVYGFVYSGLDLGGLIGPLALGWALDRNQPGWIFGGAAILLVACVPLLLRLGTTERGVARATAAG